MLGVVGRLFAEMRAQHQMPLPVRPDLVHRQFVPHPHPEQEFMHAQQGRMHEPVRHQYAVMQEHRHRHAHEPHQVTEDPAPRGLDPEQDAIDLYLESLAFFIKDLNDDVLNAHYDFLQR